MPVLDPFSLKPQGPRNDPFRQPARPAPSGVAVEGTPGVVNWVSVLGLLGLLGRQAGPVDHRDWDRLAPDLDRVPRLAEARRERVESRAAFRACP